MNKTFHLFIEFENLFVRTILPCYASPASNLSKVLQ